MKRVWGILLTVSLLVFGSFLSVAQAAGQTVWAELRPDYTITIDGSQRGFKSADNKYVYPIVYNDTTYLPLRAIGEIMGKTVNWNEAEKTVSLSGSKSGSVTSPNRNGADAEDIQVQLRPDFKIIIDNQERTFKTANGKSIEPMLYNGSIYLPLRSIGEIMGKTVGWDNDNKVVSLKDNSGTVTDADTFGGSSSSNNNDKKEIGVDEAKSIVLKHAGVNASDVTFVKAKVDYDDGKKVYDIEFYVGNKEYDYEVDVYTGTIVSHDFDIEDRDDFDDKGKTRQYITKSEASKIVLDKVPGATSNQLEIELDDDDGRAVYEGELKYKGTEYEFEINAKTGEVMKWKVDKDD